MAKRKVPSLSSDVDRIWAVLISQLSDLACALYAADPDADGRASLMRSATGLADAFRMEPDVPALRLTGVTSSGVGRWTAILVGGLILLTSCGSGPVEEVAPASNTADGQTFSLYTHCGIDELRVDGKLYERVGGPLDDGNGNPPDGWDNPYQAGRITMGGSLVVFTDDRGHKEQFQPRKGATDYKRICS